MNDQIKEIDSRPRAERRREARQKRKAKNRPAIYLPARREFWGEKRERLAAAEAVKNGAKMATESKI